MGKKKNKKRNNSPQLSSMKPIYKRIGVTDEPNSIPYDVSEFYSSVSYKRGCPTEHHQGDNHQ